VPYDLDEFIDRNGTNSVKWEAMRTMDPKAGPDTLPFWVADMDFPCAECVIEALHGRVDRKIFGYSTHRDAEYFRAVCGWYRHRFGWYVNSEDIFYSPGVVPAIAFLIDLLTESGDGVIIQRPVYYPFSNMIRSHERRIVNNALVEKGGRYEIDFDDLEAKASSPRNKLLILCSPHNPVGRVWTEAELERLGRICLDHGLFIISDEIHYDLVRRGVRHIPLETLFPEEKSRIITATAPSKTFNLAGMQLSNIVIHDRGLKARWRNYVCDRLGMSSPNALAIVATEAAYAEGEDWLSAVNDYIDGNIAFVKDFYARNMPLAEFHPPEGTYLTWTSLKAYGLSQEEIMALMSEEARVLVEAGTMFGEEGESFVRMNVACTRKTLEEGLERMAAALEGRGKGRRA